MSLTRNPLAPARSEAYTFSSSSNVVSMITRVAERDPQPFRGHGVGRGLPPHGRGVLPPFPDQYPQDQGDGQRQRYDVYPDDHLTDILNVEEVEMGKTLIDVDEQYLAAAQEALHTQTKKDTVNAALREVAALAARRRDLQRLAAGGLPDLEDEEVMRAAWRQ